MVGRGNLLRSLRLFLVLACVVSFVAVLTVVTMRWIASVQKSRVVSELAMVRFCASKLNSVCFDDAIERRVYPTNPPATWSCADATVRLFYIGSNLRYDACRDYNLAMVVGLSSRPSLKNVAVVALADGEIKDMTRADLPKFLIEENRRRKKSSSPDIPSSLAAEMLKQ